MISLYEVARVFSLIWAVYFSQMVLPELFLQQQIPLVFLVAQDFFDRAAVPDPAFFCRNPLLIEKPRDPVFSHPGQTYLFFRMLKENRERETRYQTTIEQLSGSIASGIEKIQNKLDSMTAAQDDS